MKWLDVLCFRNRWHTNVGDGLLQIFCIPLVRSTYDDQPFRIGKSSWNFMPVFFPGALGSVYFSSLELSKGSI